MCPYERISENHNAELLTALRRNFSAVESYTSNIKGAVRPVLYAAVHRRNIP